MRKKIFSIVLGTALLVAALSGCGTSMQTASTSAGGESSAAENNDGDLLSQIKQRGEIRIATEGTWSPWTYHDENDQLVGFDIEVAQAIAEKLGVKATFVEGEWDGLLAGLESGRYDIMANGVEITDERSEKYDFSEPYGYIRTAIIVQGNNDSIGSFKDLKGKTTANTLASTYAALAESYGANTTGVDDLNQTLELLLAGRVDATLNAEVTFYDYMKSHPNANLKIAALTEDASQVAIPMPKGKNSDSLRKAINAAIDELRKDGTLSEISVKYFGKDITAQ
jgi:cystine transport system substrate-binding protein